MTIKSWTDYFLDMAKTCSSRSNCLRAQVGAVVVGQDKKIKATGYNGTPSGVESCYERGECYRIKNNIPSGTCYETCRSIHAEQNAIISAARSEMIGADLYLAGYDVKTGESIECEAWPCEICLRLIKNAGIYRIINKRGTIFMRSDYGTFQQLIENKER